MTIGITGASGFLGSALLRHWAACGHDVRTSGRHRLGQPVPDGMFAGCEVVVHAAHAFGPQGAEVNVSGTRDLFAAARDAGARRQIYISSLSAHPTARSVYGATKFTIERFFLDNGGAVTRPGLVAGNGGLFARLARSLLCWRLAPLVLADRRDVAIVSLGDFLEASTQFLPRGESGACNLFAPGRLTPREFARAVWQGAGTHGWICPVPPTLAEWALRIAGAQGALDSLRGRLVPETPPHSSHLLQYVRSCTSAAEAVATAAREMVHR